MVAVRGSQGRGPHTRGGGSPRRGGGGIIHRGPVARPRIIARTHLVWDGSTAEGAGGAAPSPEEGAAGAIRRAHQRCEHMGTPASPAPPWPCSDSAVPDRRGGPGWGRVLGPEGVRGTITIANVVTSRSTRAGRGQSSTTVFNIFSSILQHSCAKTLNSPTFIKAEFFGPEIFFPSLIIVRFTVKNRVVVRGKRGTLCSN